MSFRRIIHWITQLVIFMAYVLAINVLVITLVVRVYEWRYEDRIYPGVAAMGLDLSGLGLDEAMALLDQSFNLMSLSRICLMCSRHILETFPL